MDYTSIIVAVLSAVLGGGSILFWKQDKRKKELENEKSAIEEWMALFERSEADSKEKGEKIDKLYDEKKELREKYEDALTQIADLRIQVKELEYLRCNVFECLKRIPPRFSNLKQDNNEILHNIRTDEECNSISEGNS